MSGLFQRQIRAGVLVSLTVTYPDNRALLTGTIFRPECPSNHICPALLYVGTPDLTELFCSLVVRMLSFDTIGKTTKGHNLFRFDLVHLFNLIMSLFQHCQLNEVTLRVPAESRGI